MATVPGAPIGNGNDPFGGIPKELRPTQADMLIAAAQHAQKMQMAGDVVDLSKSFAASQTINKLVREEGGKTYQTRAILNRVLGGGQVLPINPEDK